MDSQLLTACTAARIEVEKHAKQRPSRSRPSLQQPRASRAPRLQQLHDARGVIDGVQVQEAEPARRAGELVPHGAHLAHWRVRPRHGRQHVLAARAQQQHG